MDFYQKPPDEMCNKMLNIFGRYTHFVRIQTFKAKCLLYGNVPAKTHIVHMSMHIENNLILYYFYRFHSALNIHKYTLYYIVFFTSIVFQDGSCTDSITDLLFIFIYWSCFLSHFQNGGVCFSLNQGAYKAYYWVFQLYLHIHKCNTGFFIYVLYSSYFTSSMIYWNGSRKKIKYIYRTHFLENNFNQNF